MRKLLKKYLKFSLKCRDTDSNEFQLAQSIHLSRLAKAAGIDMQRVFGYLVVLDDKTKALKLQELPLKEEYRISVRLIEEICRDF